MQRQIIRLVEQSITTHRRRAALPGRVGIQVWAVGADAHPERARPSRYSLADVPEAKQPERLPTQAVDMSAAPIPRRLRSLVPALLQNELVIFDDPPVPRQKQRQGMVGHLVGAVIVDS